jgi:hypothetical protein
MHRTIEITVPPSCTDKLISQLEQEEHVINLSVVRGASIKPPGDVLTVHALNRGADQVMRLAEGAHKEGGDVSVSTSELSSIVDPKHERKVANDVDEALWEEAETGLRHQSRITAKKGGGVEETEYSAYDVKTVPHRPTQSRLQSPTQGGRRGNARKKADGRRNERRVSELGSSVNKGLVGLPLQGSFELRS